MTNSITKSHSKIDSLSTIKLVTWNINGIRACYQKNLPDFIKTIQPDILSLQETKAHKEQVEPEIVDLGFKQSFWSSGFRKGYSGVATFTNDGVFDSYRGIGVKEYDQEGRIMWTRHKHFDLYNIYFPNGSSSVERHNYKQQFLQELGEHLAFEIKRGREIIVVGDYNVAHAEIDVYDPQGLAQESGFLPEERQWFDRFLNLGFTDLFRLKNPEAVKKYSWWSYKDNARMKNNGWRIDYICVTKGLLNHFKSCEILMNQEGSDHAPVIAQFEF